MHLAKPKLDGYRIQGIKEGCEARLYSRNGHKWTKRLALLADALAYIPCRSAVLDVELCFPTLSGAPDFFALHSAGAGRQHELVVFAFDLLHRDGQDQGLPLVERRRRLEWLLARSEVPCLFLVEAFEDGAKLLESAERFKLEGIVSKRKAAPYCSGDCRNWVKVKTESWRAANRDGLER